MIIVIILQYSRLDFYIMALTATRCMALALALGSSVIMADQLDQAFSESTEHSQAAKQSQRKVESLDDSTQQMLDGYRAAIIQAANLERYNEQMRELVQAQEKELASYEQQLKDLEQTEASVAPQMQRMLDVLAEFIAADLPFLPHERSDRLERLQELLPRADVSLAEKYRRLLEAYQIESDYGYTLEAWRDNLQRDGQTLDVDFLRLGRVMLYYRRPIAMKPAGGTPKPASGRGSKGAPNVREPRQFKVAPNKNRATGCNFRVKLWLWR